MGSNPAWVWSAVTCSVMQVSEPSYAILVCELWSYGNSASKEMIGSGRWDPLPLIQRGRVGAFEA